MMFRKLLSEKKETAHIYWQTIKMNLGITIIYSLLLFLIYPLRTFYTLWNNYMTNISTSKQIVGASVGTTTYTAQGVTAYSSSIVLSSLFLYILPIIFCVIFALNVFKYLHNKTTTDFYHSLPIKRTSLFLAKYFAGITMFIVPYIITLVITFLLENLFPGASIPFLYMLKYFIFDVFLFLFIYTMTVFIAMNTGTTFDAVIIFLAVNISWTILISTLKSLFSGMLYGFSGFSDNLISYIQIIFSPWLILFTRGYSRNSIEYSYILMYIIFSILAAVGSILLYKKRKSDYAGNSMSYSYMKTLIKIVISITAGLSVASGLSLQHKTTIMAVQSFAIGFISVSFVAYLITHLILERGFKRIGKALIFYGVTVAGVALIYCIMGLDVFGYQTKIPKVNDIKYISVSDRTSNSAMEMKYYDETSLKVFTELHREIIKETERDQNSKFVLNKNSTMIGESKSYEDRFKFVKDNGVINPQKRYDSVYMTNAFFEKEITLTYHLKNGTHFTRQYSFGNDTFAYELEDIYNLEEYKIYNNPLFSENFAEGETCTIYDDYSYFKYFANEELTEKLVEAMKQDYKNSSNEDLNKNPVCVLIIDFPDTTGMQMLDSEITSLAQLGTYGVDYENCYFVYPGFENTIKLIEQETQHNFTSFPEGTRAVLCNFLTPGLWNGYDYDMSTDYYRLDFNTVSDPEKVQQLRDSTVKYDRNYMDSGVFLQYYYPDGTRSQLFYCWGRDMPGFTSNLVYKRMTYNEIN